MNQLVPSRTAVRPEIDAFVATEEGRDAVTLLLQRLGDSDRATLQTGTLETVARLAGLAPFRKLMIVELGEGEMRDHLEAVREIVAEGGELVLLGRENSVAAYRSFLAAGVRDYLALPLEAEFVLPDVFAAPKDASMVPDSQTKGRVVAVCGVSGGVGASLLAANLSVACLDELSPANSGKSGAAKAGRVGLLDADFAFGSLAVDFDIEATQGVFETLERPERVDSTYLQSSMAEVVPGLYVYAGELHDPEQLGGYEEGLAGLLHTLKEEFPLTVVDLPRRLLAQDVSVLREVEDVVLVLAPGFSALRSAGRLIERLRSHSPATRVWTVLSQSRRDAGLRPKEIADALGRPLTNVLPLSSVEIARASVKGAPLQSVFPRSGYARKVADLAHRLLSVSDSETVTVTARQPWWKKRSQ
ncbi:AAA family ATPase [Celeribacter sp. SCSIO 80788]|uniref:AAA family ATPase n=1 Tax=Celeribacter sp. SCSIO 80788 TaxID=3117013 RepID=UPI003DA39EA0